MYLKILTGCLATLNLSGYYRSLVLHLLKIVSIRIPLSQNLRIAAVAGPTIKIIHEFSPVHPRLKIDPFSCA